MSDKSYVGDIGTILEVDCGVDISASTTHNLMVQKPDLTTVELVGVIHNVNFIRYTTIDGDLDQAGVYRIQSKIVISAWEGLGETAKLRIYDPYE